MTVTASLSARFKIEQATALDLGNASLPVSNSGAGTPVTYDVVILGCSA